MKNLNFPIKRSSRKSNIADVTIRINKNGLHADGEYRYSVVFRFYNDSWRKIVNTEEYILFAIDETDNRIYFKESNALEGYKLSKNNSTTNNLSVTKTVADADWWELNKGDYVLAYDKQEKLHYIDLKKKK